GDGRADWYLDGMPGGVMIRSLGLVVLAAAVAAPSNAQAAAPPPKPVAPAPSPSPAASVPSDVVATIDGEPFTARQLEDAARARPFPPPPQPDQAQRHILH